MWFPYHFCNPKLFPDPTCSFGAMGSKKFRENLPHRSFCLNALIYKPKRFKFDILVQKGSLYKRCKISPKSSKVGATQFIIFAMFGFFGLKPRNMDLSLWNLAQQNNSVMLNFTLIRQISRLRIAAWVIPELLLPVILSTLFGSNTIRWAQTLKRFVILKSVKTNEEITYEATIKYSCI